MDEDDDPRHGFLDLCPGKHHELRSDAVDSDGYDPYHDEEEDIDEQPPYSSPSPVSSLDPFSNAVSPLRRELSRTTLHDEPEKTSTNSSSRLALARRLSSLAQQLAEEDEVDELTLMAHVDQLEKTLAQSGPRSPPNRTTQHRRPASFGGWRTQSGAGGLVPASYRSEFSASLMTGDPMSEEPREKDPSKKGLTLRQANKIVQEANKLNEELTAVVTNLRARQEESDHIHDLLIERAERAAQRIIFLQARIAHLEEELGQNDDELQNLRICLKAVEIQMPPHPDPTIQRCISSFKEDYQRLRRKRASRGSLSTLNGDESYTTTNGQGEESLTMSPQSGERWR